MAAIAFRRGKTMAICNEKIAMVAGVNAGIIAELLNDMMKHDGKHVMEEYGKRWCRCSYKTMIVYCPFLSIDQAKGAIYALREKGILVKDCFNETKFDHTNWHAFTEYGRLLLEAEV